MPRGFPARSSEPTGRHAGVISKPLLSCATLEDLRGRIVTPAVVAAAVALAPAAALSSSIAPPAITLHVSGQEGDNGWYRSDVTVSWTVSDPTGISTSSGCEPRTLTSDTPGTTRRTLTGAPLAYATRHGREEGRL